MERRVFTKKEEHTVAFMIKIFWFLVELNVVI